MRVVIAPLLLGFVGTCEGFRTKPREQEVPEAPAAQSFAQTSQEAPKRSPLQALTTFLAAANQAAALSLPSQSRRTGAVQTTRPSASLRQQAPPMMQLVPELLRDQVGPVEGPFSGIRGFAGNSLATSRLAHARDFTGDSVNAPPDASVVVQGGALRTWSYQYETVEQVQIVLTSDGRPMNSDIELWLGPANTPVKMRLYVDDGMLRPFSAVLDTPRGPNTVGIRNIGQLEFPLSANVIPDAVDQPSGACISSPRIIQGGALRTYPFDESVESVQIYLKTDGRPLNARIEILQGPNNIKQVVELYTEDGLERPFFCLMATPGGSNNIRIINTGPISFPMAASIVPHLISESPDPDGGDVIVTGGAPYFK